MMITIRTACLRAYGAIGLILLTTLVYAEDTTLNHNHGDAVNAMKQGQGKKWETDAPLRLGMENIRQVMVASKADIVKERLSAKDYQRLAEAVETNVSSILKNCKLREETDRAFHTIVLADLTGGAELMRASPKIQMKRVGALAVMQTLQNYGKYFQHPGWSMDVESKP